MKRQTVTIWVVERVWRGLIEYAAVFRNRKAAIARERRWRMHLNREDELEVFQRTVRLPN
jgi:hypothetical protein